MTGRASGAAQLASQQSTYEVGTLPDYIDSFASKIHVAIACIAKVEHHSAPRPCSLDDKNNLNYNYNYNYAKV